MATPTNLPAAVTAGQVATASDFNNLRGAFRVLQVVMGTYATLASSTSATYADSGLTASITPQANTNKVLVLVNQSVYTDATGQDLNMRLVRDSTTLQTQAATLNIGTGTYVVHYLDSPASTSALTYNVQFARGSGSGTVYVNINSNPANIILCEISA
jgi:hypothetical protein